MSTWAVGLATVLVGLGSGGSAAPTDPVVPFVHTPDLPVRAYDAPQMSPYKHLWARSSALYSTKEDTSKLMTIGDFLALPEVFDHPVTIAVYTDGEPSRLVNTPTAEQVLSGEQTWITIHHGTRSTPDEIQALARHGEIGFVSELGAHVELSVTTKDDIRAVQALPFVFLIKIYGPNGGELVPLQAHDASIPPHLTAPAG